MDENALQPRLAVEQKITAFVNKYRVLDVAQEGKTGGLKALAQQKRLAFKEKVTFYADEEKSTELFTFRAEKVMDVHGRYFIEDNDGRLLGMFRKEFKKSLFLSSWIVMNAEGTELYRVKESNVILALIRRFIGFVPLIGELLDIVMSLFKYHFSFVTVANNKEAAQYKKTTLLRDHYELATTDTAWNELDWRVYAAMGVALDALQGR